jgi:hypothetical protein
MGEKFDIFESKKVVKIHIFNLKLFSLSTILAEILTGSSPPMVLGQKKNLTPNGQG